MYLIDVFCIILCMYLITILISLYENIKTTTVNYIAPILIKNIKNDEINVENIKQILLKQIKNGEIKAEDAETILKSFE